MTLLRRWCRLARVRPPDLLAAVGVVAFVAAVYVLIVLGGGVALGRPGSASMLLSVTATIVVAAGFDPVRRGLASWAGRRFGQPASEPSRLLASFLAGTGGHATPEQVTDRMARVLSDGLGGRATQVWLLVGERLRLAGACPAPDRPPQPPDLAGARSTGVRPVWHGGELLGVLAVEERAGEPLAPVEEHLLDGLAAGAGLVLRNLRLTAELQERYREVSERAAVLATARRRVVALEDQERRRLERDIHDGAQQRLVALAVGARLALSRLGRRPEQAPELIAGLTQTAEQAAAELVELVGGRHHVIAGAGLAAALRAAADISPVPAEVDCLRLARYPEAVEQALYYCCVEALQNVAKHAAAGSVRIDLRDVPGGVTARIQDDGRGFTSPSAQRPSGGGLANIRERMAAVGGTLAVQSTPGRGTVVEAFVPAQPMAGDS